MRKQFTMTKEQQDKLLEACRPLPYIIIGGMAPPSQQERANIAWRELGREMGFDGMTAQPDESNPLQFTAEVIADK